MRPESFRSPVTLTGRHVELVPLEWGQRDELHLAATDPEVGRYLRQPPGPTIEDLDRLIASLLEAQAAGTDLPFTTRRLPDHRAIGMTRYLRIDRANQWVEIGGTWLAPAFWRTPVNTETKLLMMQHAFEVEAAHRVQLQTDARNERSQRAIQRLGAVREGLLREDVVLPDGHRRSSVYFSVLATEWPEVKTRLESLLSRPWAAPVSANGSPPGHPE
jgi:RimJ/RimL family protein N-acetyltransferase